VKRIAVYPGSFDPVTQGHLDIIRRAACLFDHVIVAVSENSPKQYTFPLHERVEMIRKALGSRPRVGVEPFSGLLTHFVKSRKARILIRGLRAISDFEREFQMALMNRKLHPDIETVFLMPDEKYTYLSSSLVKEVAGLGGNPKKLVPPNVSKRLKALSGRRKQWKGIASP